MTFLIENITIIFGGLLAMSVAGLAAAYVTKPKKENHQ